jgi:ferritin-like metal-binding protein YciE
MTFENLSEVLADQLRDIYNAENQLVKALPKLVKRASSRELKDAISSHLKETEGHVKRLETIGKKLDIKLRGKVCRAMEGLIEEGKEAIDSDGEGALVDTALIAAAQRVEHYEMAAYGTARAVAEQLGHSDVAELLQATLNEEKAADEKLTQISLEEILVGAAAGGADEPEESAF